MWMRPVVITDYQLSRNLSRNVEIGLAHALPQPVGDLDLQFVRPGAEAVRAAAGQRREVQPARPGTANQIIGVVRADKHIQPGAEVFDLVGSRWLRPWTGPRPGVRMRMRVRDNRSWQAELDVLIDQHTLRKSLCAQRQEK